MFGIVVATLLLAILLLYKSYQRRRRELNVPGPSPLLSFHYVGHGYLLGSDPVTALHKFRKDYGDVFRLDVGDFRTVIVCGRELIEEGLRSADFTGRTHSDMEGMRCTFPVDSKGNCPGPIPSSGPVWQEQRKFMLHHLTDLGMGSKDFMDSIIVQEAEYLTQRMKKLSGQEIQVQSFFHTTTNNVIWRIITGKSSKQDDPELADLTRRVTLLMESLDPGSVMTLLQMSSSYFLKACSFLGISNVFDSSRPFIDMIKEEVRASEGVEGNFFVHRCWAELERKKDDPTSSFYGNDGHMHMCGQLEDFFMAGTDTSATFLEWGILYMCQYPHIQDRLHQDIKDCIGIDGSISVSDTFRLPLVEATIEEIFRHCPELAMLLPHATVTDATLGGHVIPKGTQVFFFIETIHRDPQLFDKPDQFNPSRFIDADTNTFKRNDHIMLFGGNSGRRKCIGERLARVEAFVFFATLMQKFRFSKVSEDQILDFGPVSGAVFHPKPFDVVVELRK